MGKKQWKYYLGQALTNPILGDHGILQGRFTIETPNNVLNIGKVKNQNHQWQSHEGLKAREETREEPLDTHLMKYLVASVSQPRRGRLVPEETFQRGPQTSPMSRSKALSQATTSKQSEESEPFYPSASLASSLTSWSKHFMS